MPNLATLKGPPDLSEASHNSPNSPNHSLNNWLGSSLPSFLFNVRSIVNKSSRFQSLVCSSGLKIIGITETWLSNAIYAIYANKIIPTGYNIYWSDRPSKGGGVLLAIDHSIHSSLNFSPVDLEILAVSVLTNPDFIICFIHI